MRSLDTNAFDEDRKRNATKSTLNASRRNTKKNEMEGPIRRKVACLDRLEDAELS